ncbi:DUF3012 domain-containing protein [Pontibacter sp. JAM-7]|uniref:DUF3012 domain-containing protein n=1 Tax=Pontibacter sp. JAM-7 TaxID=3366581 RepID=UPI003AF714AB
MKRLLSILCLSTLVLGLAACSAEVGSPEWCAEMKEKPKGEWTANEAAEFTKSCIFQ